VLVVVVAVAGAVASVRAEVEGLAVLFGVVGVVSIVGLWPVKGRRSMPVRTDLARWLDELSAVTAEPVEEVLDRSISAYRSSMSRSLDG
jgi:hypothetical protein